MSRPLDPASIDFLVRRAHRLRQRVHDVRRNLEVRAAYAPARAEASTLVDRAEVLTRRSHALWRYGMALAITRTLCYGDPGPDPANGPLAPWPPSSGRMSSAK